MDTTEETTTTMADEVEEEATEEEAEEDEETMTELEVVEIQEKAAAEEGEFALSSFSQFLSIIATNYREGGSGYYRSYYRGRGGKRGGGYSEGGSGRESRQATGPTSSAGEEVTVT